MSNSTGRYWFPGMLLSALTLLLLLWSCSAVPPAAMASGAQSERPSFRVDVELVTVEVIVLDKKGFPIRNLKKEDFELYEDGKRQEIITFAEISDEQNREVPTSLADVDDGGLNRGKVVLILFDDSHISSGQLQVAREAAEKYVKEQMRPQDLFAVATYGLSLKLLQNYTHDPAKVIGAIRQPAISFASGTRQGETFSGPGTMGPVPGSRPAQNAAVTRSAEMRMRLASLFRALSSVSASVAAIRGRKAVLLFSEDFSGNSEVQSDFTTTIDQARKANVAFYTIDIAGLMGGRPLVEISPAKRGTSPGGDAVRRAFSRVRFPPGGISPGGLAGFSMVQQSGGGQSGGGQTGGGSSGTRGGGGTSPPTSGGSTGGRTTPGGTPGATTPGTNAGTDVSRGNSTGMGTSSRQEQPDFGRFGQATLDNMLRSLAGETGGVAIYNTGDFNGRLNEVTRELNNYYVLGFQSNSPKRDGKLRRLKVKTEVKKADLRYRESYLDPRPLDSLAGSKGEKAMLRALASPAPAVQLPVIFNALYFYESPGLARIPVTAKIRTGSVELKNKGGQLSADLDIMGVAYGEDGGVSGRFSETMHVSMTKDGEAAFRQDGVTYRNHFKLRPGRYQLRFAVADQKGKVGSADQLLVLPAQNGGGLTASSLVLIEQASRLPALIQDLQIRLLEDNDPLIYRGMQIVPCIDKQLPAGKPVNVAFKIYNLSGSAAQPELLRLAAEPRLIAEDGAIHSLPPVVLDPKHLYPTGNSETMVAMSLPFTNATPGRYKLVVAASEGATNRTITLETDLQLR